MSNISPSWQNLPKLFSGRRRVWMWWGERYKERWVEKHRCKTISELGNRKHGPHCPSHAISQYPVGAVWMPCKLLVGFPCLPAVVAGVRPPQAVPLVSPQERPSPSWKKVPGWVLRAVRGLFSVTPEPWGRADCRHDLSKAGTGAGPGSAGPRSQHMHLTLRVTSRFYWYHLSQAGWGQGSSTGQVLKRSF